MPLYDYFCSCESYSETTPYEEFVSSPDEVVLCPICGKAMERNPFSIAQTGDHSPKYRDMHRKSVMMRKRMTGQIPWRKHSESQTD